MKQEKKNKSEKEKTNIKKIYKIKNSNIQKMMEYIKKQETK